MKRINSFIFILFFVLIPTVVSSQPEDSPTLTDCYQLALKQSETVAINQEAIREAQARFGQALSTILPRASYSYSQKWEDAGGSSSRETPEGKFTFSQPLFTGFKEFAAIAAGRSEKKQRQHELKRAKQLLFKDVADAFYFYLNYQQDIETLESIRAVLADRRVELVKREELGRSRLSEIASVDARISRVEADIEEVKGEKDVAAQLLAFLTGSTFEVVNDDRGVIQELKPLSEYESYTENRPDVLAEHEAFIQAKKNITIERSKYWPTVEAKGNQYTKRVGSSKDIDWDATLSVDVPLFEGGETAGAVREARSQAKQEQLKFEQVKRSALLDIQNSYSQLQSSIRRYQAISKALDAAQKNYDLQLEDFRVNLVSNLDILQVLEDLQDSRRDHIAIQNEMKRRYWQFQVSLGKAFDDTF
ncbi:MAG: TolC family protein [Candidatus Omnitrophota bacterium]